MFLLFCLARYEREVIADLLETDLLEAIILDGEQKLGGRRTETGTENSNQGGQHEKPLLENRNRSREQKPSLENRDRIMLILIV